MTADEILSCARRALHDMDDTCALRSNPLLLHLDVRTLGHDRLRAHVLRALESLEPGSCDDASRERRGRHHAILLRCDVQRASHKEVAVALGLSRRQFYRDRRAALLEFAKALGERAKATIFVEPDARDVRLLYIETLRERGRYDLVWRESMRALREMKGDPREVEVWTVAAEAARFFGNVAKSQEAIDAMQTATNESVHAHMRRASQLRIAICQIALYWMRADFSKAQSLVAEVVRTCGDERTMYGRDATLFGVLLNYGAWLAIDGGDWEAAAEYTRRSERIAQRSEVVHFPAILHRLRGQLALQHEGDAKRAAVELRDALAIARTHKALAPLASSAVDLGLTLLADGERAGAEYVEYGLAIGRDACGYDDYAVLFTSALPKLLDRLNAGEAMEGIDELRARSPLFRRADLYARLAQSQVLLRAGKSDEAADASTELARELEGVSLLPAAAEAHVISAEALARERRALAARRALKQATELIASFGSASTRMRAAHLSSGLALAMPGA